MQIEGRLEKCKNYWAVSIPLLLIYTQGKNKKEALMMAKDAIECLVEEKNFKVTVCLRSDSSTFNIRTNDESQLMAFILRQQRLHYKSSIKDIMTRLKLKSPQSYRRYERGQVKPNLNQFSKFLRAINSDLELVLKI